MKCRVCGSRLQPTTTNLPFELTERTLVVFEQLPVYVAGWLEHTFEHIVTENPSS